MATIKIIEKFQGQGLGRMDDETWSILSKLDGGTILENDSIIELITTTGQKATANRNKIHDANNNVITYILEVDGGGKTLIDKIPAEPEQFLLRFYYRAYKSYYILLEIDENTSNEHQLSNDFMRKKKLDSQQLSLLSFALIKNLFPKPNFGDLLVKESKEDSSCVLYFELDYYDKMITAIIKAYKAGSFAQSKSEGEWNNLMNALKSATLENKIEKETLTPYFLFKK